MIPKSRLVVELQREMGNTNIFRLPNWRHVIWHQAFLNMTPLEVIACLTEHYAPHLIEEAHIYANVFGSNHRYRLNKRNRPMPLVDGYILNDKRSLCLVRLFRGYSWPQIIEEVVDKWSPPEYFRYVKIAIRHQGEIVRIERTPWST